MIQAISSDMPYSSGVEILDFSDLTLSPRFCDYHLHFSKKSLATAQSPGALLVRSGIGKAYEGGDKGLAGLAVKEAVDAGVSALIHGLHVSDSTLSAMAANNVAFVPGQLLL